VGNSLQVGQSSNSEICHHPRHRVDGSQKSPLALSRLERVSNGGEWGAEVLRTVRAVCSGVVPAALEGIGVPHVRGAGVRREGGSEEGDSSEDDRGAHGGVFRVGMDFLKGAWSEEIDDAEGD